MSRRLRCLLKRCVHHANDNLNVLARSDFGHHASKASVKIDLRRDLIGEHRAFGIDNRDSRLIARALDGEHELASLNLGSLILRPINRRKGPYTHHGRCRLGRGSIDWKGKRKLRLHHKCIGTLAIVVSAPSNLLEAKVLVQRHGGSVSVFHLERRRRAAKHLGIVAYMGQKLSSYARTPALGRHGNIENLHVVLDDHAARKTNELAVVMSHPPTTRHGGALTQLRKELGWRPRRMSRTGKTGRLEDRCRLRVRRTHGPKLQVTAGELICHARHFALSTLDEP